MSRVLFFALAARPLFSNFTIGSAEPSTIGRIRIEILAVIHVALDLVHEAAVFAFVAGLPPLVGS